MFCMLDLYKIGVGPSSSHTVGPMKAGKQFADDLLAAGRLDSISRIEIDVYGSLALTGKGHCTDHAILLGLVGEMPDTVEIDSIAGRVAKFEARGVLPLGGQRDVGFSMVFHPETFLALHENGMRISAWSGESLNMSKTYYSLGGGFIVDEENFGSGDVRELKLPYPFHSAADLLAHCRRTSLSLSGLVMANELALHEREVIEAHFARVWQVMQNSMERGMRAEGALPGPMNVPRRASALRRQLMNSERLSHDPMNVIDWVNMYAMAMSEENAAGGRVVTAPTNGACGIVPAVLAYYNQFIQPLDTDACVRFFLASGVVGSLFKMNASISGAEVGCQGEVGVACSMAAAGLTELAGGSPEQVCVAAEIAMEHNLGLTCDPVGGQVQIPCIERNAIAAVKAINASRMALRRNSEPRVSLDKVIAAMFDTGKDMNPKYRETSCGGLAVQIVPLAQVLPMHADTAPVAA
ncbi:L-serine ammonia-lyase [Paludibacterium yongneupense]|uniref:L-serine ammonia-lyase n=1 Tax=Paludibacterium yongneupense TaxID=400061 RepID=UPI00042352B7|nr:L-serine ammonia-lyase [Paludibacterium yongneupense]